MVRRFNPAKLFYILLLVANLFIAIPDSYAKSEAKSLKEQGDFLYFHGDVEEAIGKFEQALQIEPDMVEAHMSLVNLYLMRKNQEAAIKHAEAVARIDSDSASAHMLLGNLLRARDKKRAIEEFEKALSIGIKDSSLRTNLGYMYLEQNQISKALGCFNEAKLNKKASLNASIGAAVAKYRLGRRDEAISDMDSLIKEHGKVSSFLATKGHLLLGMGKTKAAMDAYSEAILSNPRDAKLMVKLADMHYKEGNKTKAEAMFKQALKADPANVDAYYSLGIINQKRNNLEQAAQFFEKGANLDKSSSSQRKMFLHARRLKQKAGILDTSSLDQKLISKPIFYPSSSVFGYSYSSLLNKPDSSWIEMGRAVDNAKKVNLSGSKNKTKIDIKKPHLVPGRMH